MRLTPMRASFTRRGENVCVSLRAMFHDFAVWSPEEKEPPSAIPVNGRDEFGRIGVTDTYKHLVLGTDGLIAARIKLVGVDSQDGITREIGEQAGVVRRGKQIEQGDGVGIKAGCRNDISREGFADKPRLRSRRSSGGTSTIRPARRRESRDWIGRTTENGACGGGLKNLAERRASAVYVGLRAALREHFG